MLDCSKEGFVSLSILCAVALDLLFFPFPEN